MDALCIRHGLVIEVTNYKVTNYINYLLYKLLIIEVTNYRSYQL